MTISGKHTNDAVNVAPHLHSILYEDDKVRVLKVAVKPGDTAAMHWHPYNVSYILSGGKLRFAKADGTHVDLDLTDGEVAHGDEGSHEVENIGARTVQVVQVELKTSHEKD